MCALGAAILEQGQWKKQVEAKLQFNLFIIDFDLHYYILHKSRVP